eukprot:33828-Chlamydomonas_euryale.AAC.1
MASSGKTRLTDSWMDAWTDGSQLLLKSRTSRFERRLDSSSVARLRAWSAHPPSLPTAACVCPHSTHGSKVLWYRGAPAQQHSEQQHCPHPP